MLGYLFLSVSIISGSIKGFFGKKVSNKTNGFRGAVLANLIRMLFCIPVGFVFVLFDGGVSSLSVSKKVLLISAFGGIATSIFIATWLLAVQKSAFTAVDTFVSMGILIPIVLSCIIYKETITYFEIIGLILLLFSVVVMSLYSNQIKQKLSLLSILLLFVVGIANGFNEFSYKIFQYNKGTTPASAFNFYIYVFSAITLSILFLCLSVKKASTSDTPTKMKRSLDKQTLLYIAIMATFLFCNSYFKTLAATRLSAIQIYPLAQGSALILTLLMSSLFFKEKIKPLCIIGLIIMFTGLIFINIVPLLV